MSNMLGDALVELAGPLKDFLEKLAGPEGRRWLEAFKRFLRKEEPWPAFPIWKTITIGTHKAVDKLKADLLANGFQISEWANDILNRITLAAKKTKLDLVLVTVAELGFKDGAYLSDIYKRALEIGLELCPAEAGPQLRLQYKDQPVNEWILIAMEAVSGSDRFLYLFHVERGDDGAWLRCDLGKPDSFWNGHNRFVFVRRK